MYFKNTKRIYTQENVNGTETGRTSTSILKPPVHNGKAGIALQQMTKHEDSQLSEAGGSDLRSMFIADPEFVFVEPDLSQAEDRVVCVLSKDWQALKEYDRKDFKYNKHGIKDDRHTLTAMDVCSLNFEDITDYYRQIGKKTRHAGNYDMKKKMHMLNLAKFAGVYISEYQAGIQLERFHSSNPNIKNVYHKEIVEALENNNNVLRTPFGRMRQFFNRWGEELFKEAYAYIPQSSVSDQTKFAMLRIKRRLSELGYYLNKFFFCLESHDSFLSLCHESILDKTLPVIKQELEQPINFEQCSLSRQYMLIIPCEIKVGKRWIDYSSEWGDGMKKITI